jgi:hypothetical protein
MIALLDTSVLAGVNDRWVSCIVTVLLEPGAPTRGIPLLDHRDKPGVTSIALKGGGRRNGEAIPASVTFPLLCKTDTIENGRRD